MQAAAIGYSTDIFIFTIFIGNYYTNKTRSVNFQSILIITTVRNQYQLVPTAHNTLMRRTTAPTLPCNTEAIKTGCLNLAKAEPNTLRVKFRSISALFLFRERNNVR